MEILERDEGVVDGTAGCIESESLVGDRKRGRVSCVRRVSFVSKARHVSARCRYFPKLARAAYCEPNVNGPL